MKYIKRTIRFTIFPGLLLVFLSVLLSTPLSALQPPNTALAETRTKITQVNLTVTSNIQSGISGTIYVTTNDTIYSVGDVTIENDDGEWNGNFKPRVSVYLEASEDYYFSSTSKSIFHFSGEKCTFVSAKRRDSGTGLELVFRMGQIGSGDLTASGLEWDPTSGIASWDEIPGAKSYQVCLYRGSSAFSDVKSTTNRRYDFSSIIDQQGDYFFRVRAVGYGSDKGEWEESDIGYVSANQAEDFRYEHRSTTTSGSSYSGPGATSGGPSSPSTSSPVGPAFGNSGNGNSSNGPGNLSNSGNLNNAGASNNTGTSNNSGNSNTFGNWVQDAVGWWYRFPNGNYPVNCWQNINNKWYYFNQYGYMAVGWIQSNNRWYYCGSDGSMYTNSRTPDGFYVGGDGAWIP